MLGVGGTLDLRRLTDALRTDPAVKRVKSRFMQKINEETNAPLKPQLEREVRLSFHQT